LISRLFHKSHQFKQTFYDTILQYFMTPIKFSIPDDFRFVTSIDIQKFNSFTHSHTRLFHSYEQFRNLIIWCYYFSGEGREKRIILFEGKNCFEVIDDTFLSPSKKKNCIATNFCWITLSDLFTPSRHFHAWSTHMWCGDEREKNNKI
jgi:hypothetical protein